MKKEQLIAVEAEMRVCGTRVWEMCVSDPETATTASEKAEEHDDYELAVIKHFSDAITALADAVERMHNAKRGD
jgi:hypothetical protein